MSGIILVADVHSELHRMHVLVVHPGQVLVRLDHRQNTIFTIYTSTHALYQPFKTNKNALVYVSSTAGFCKFLKHPVELALKIRMFFCNVNVWRFS